MAGPSIRAVDRDDGLTFFARYLAKFLRHKSGFSSQGTPVILDVSLSSKEMASALRAQGYNVRSVQEIFGRTDLPDDKILELARSIGARVLARDRGHDMDGGFFEAAIVVDQRVKSPETVGRILGGAINE